MLLANSSVREAAKTARVCRIRHAPLAASLYSLFIQNHCAKSETFGFFKTNSGNVNEPLMWEVRFLSETDNGDFRVCQYASTRRFACAPFLAPKSLRQIGNLWLFKTNSEIVGIALLRSNGRKGRSPFNGWRPVPPSLFIQNHCAKSETFGFFKTNSGNVNEPLMWEVRFSLGD